MSLLEVWFDNGKQMTRKNRQPRPQLASSTAVAVRVYRAGLTSPTVTVPDLPTTARKVGANYVSWESLVQPGDTLQQTINRVTGGKVLTFPPGVFDLPANFPLNIPLNKGGRGGEGIRIGNATGGLGCGGLSGSGPTTIFRMASSNRDAAYPSGVVNEYYLIRAAPSGGRYPYEFSNFTLDATTILHDCNGLRLDNNTGTIVENLRILGVKGSNKVPPGETGAIQTYNCDHCTFSDTEIDGRRNGVPVSASPVMINNSQFMSFYRCYFHHSVTGGGGIAWYVSTDGHVEDCRSEYIGTGFGNLGGYCFNHEQANRIKYVRPKMICARSLGDRDTLHMSLNSDANRGGVDNVLTVIDPTWDATSVGGGKFVVHTWDLLNKTTGIDVQVQRRAPDVYKVDGVTRLPFYYLIPSKYAATNVYP